MIINTNAHTQYTSTAIPVNYCPYCGAYYHTGICPSVRAIEYHPNGVVKRVEFARIQPIPHDVEIKFDGENWNWK